MKLIFCPECQDVRKLQLKRVKCMCGKAYGKYLWDQLNAEIGGTAVPLGFDNFSFVKALGARPKKDFGSRFEAFVIPWECPTVKFVGLAPKKKSGNISLSPILLHFLEEDKMAAKPKKKPVKKAAPKPVAKKPKK